MAGKSSFGFQVSANSAMFPEHGPLRKTSAKKLGSLCQLPPVPDCAGSAPQALKKTRADAVFE